MKEARHKRPRIVWFNLYEMSREGKPIKKENRLEVACTGGWEYGLTVNGHEGSYWGHENVLKLICDAGCTIWYIY